MPENEPTPSPEEALVIATERMAGIISDPYDAVMLKEAFGGLEDAAKAGKEEGILSIEGYLNLLETNSNIASGLAHSAQDTATAEMFNWLNRSYGETLRVLGFTAVEGQKTDTYDTDMSQKKDNSPK